MNKNLFALFIFCPLFCVIGAIMMALNGKEGWGWLLLTAIIMTPYITNANKDTEEDDEEE